MKRIDEITEFLHKSFADLNRIFKNEISIKTELTIDLVNIKPININTKNLTNLIDKINPKTICFDANVQEEPRIARGKEKDTVETKYGRYRNPSQNESNVESDANKPKHWSRNESNVSYSTDERKNLDTLKVPRPKKNNFKDRIKSAAARRLEEVGSELEKTVTDESINMLKLPFIKTQGREGKDKNNSKFDDLSDMSAVFAIGDIKSVLKYFIEDNYWQMIDFDEKNSNLKSSIRYSSLCYIGNQKMILTGSSY